MSEKTFGMFIAQTRGIPCTFGEEVVLHEADGDRVLTDVQRADLMAEYEAWSPAMSSDADAELQAAISGASTLDELKAALLGKRGPARAAGRPA